MEPIIRYAFAAIVFLVVSLAIALSWKERLYPKTINTREVVQYGSGAKLIALIMVIAAALTVGAKLNAKPDDQFLATILVSVFCSIAALVVLETLFVRIEFDKDYVYTYSPWRRNRVIPWREIIGHRFVGFHVIETKSKGAIILQTEIDGVRGFLAEVHRRLRAS